MMETTEIYARLTPIFREVLDDDGLVVRPELTARDVEEWDSLRHVRLIVTVEKELGVRFSAAEIAGLDNVGQFVALIAAKLGARAGAK